MRPWVCASLDPTYDFRAPAIDPRFKQQILRQRALECGVEARGLGGSGDARQRSAELGQGPGAALLLDRLALLEMKRRPHRAHHIVHGLAGVDRPAHTM